MKKFLSKIIVFAALTIIIISCSGQEVSQTEDVTIRESYSKGSIVSEMLEQARQSYL